MITNSEILEYINEDLPFMDLTTSLQSYEKTKARLELFTRVDCVASCTEISAKIAEILDCEVKFVKSSRSFAKEGDMLLAYEGEYANIHKAWKLTQVLLEYSCAIATYTNKMLNLAKSVNQKCQILGTRKTFPFAKKFCVQALLDGGGEVHRLNLSDSILFFDKHRIVYKNSDEFFADLRAIKHKVPEKKVVVEALNLDDAIKLLEIADVIQLDKMSLEDTKKIVELRDKNYKNVKIISAGGINVNNVKDYASCGIDAVVTSAMYLSGIGNIKAKISKI
ncbi:quinolinate phosphoribosyltransferase-like protein [Campylobacter blaseri]|uniref:Putative pyrophosphorylase ModD n=1 Tax=Campylobacter blaseri TaxID=2042961 RepID=A0A2P8R1D3_9BACT|nr:ModD protein [Campylobacter blaseri]PSM52301.1 ModD protein [Campylobacter blaseri]PSM54067.1 ModD protein [Campylobacter blaseri]QKF85508.1 quinolinate phosphoribosyltransferase-like protein [Campylobacter blaseri]